MHKEIILNKKLTQTRGTLMSLKTNFIISVILAEGEVKEFIADFRKIWFIVSHTLVRAIRNKVKNRPSFILGYPSFLWSSAKQK